MPLTWRLLHDSYYTYGKALADQIVLNICSNILAIMPAEMFAKRKYAKRKYFYIQPE